MKRNVPFRQEFKDSMIMMAKTCTSRTKGYGHIGDTFGAFGCEFKITAVDKMILRDVSALLYRQEGCLSPEQFEKVWAKIHPRKGFAWNHFERVI